MKRLIFIFAILLSTIPSHSQNREKVQKGYVRSMSYVTQKGEPINGAEITRKDGKVNSAFTNSSGYFELSMEKIDSKDQTYRIGSVKTKGDYKLYSPDTNDILQFSPIQKLLIILKSDSIEHDFISRTYRNAQKHQEKIFKDSLDYVWDLYNRKVIDDNQKDSIIINLEAARNNQDSIIKYYIQNQMAKRDFELIDSEFQKIDLEIASGNIKEALKLINANPYYKNIDNFITFDSINSSEKEKSILALSQAVVANATVFNMDKVLMDMEKRLKLDPKNIEYLCELGELQRKYFTNLTAAKNHYQKAVEECELQEKSDYRKAVCLSKLAETLGSLQENQSCESTFLQALNLLEQNNKETKELYDVYCGLGKLYFNIGNFEQAKTYLEKCLIPSTKEINIEANITARLTLANIQESQGNFKIAEQEYYILTEEIDSYPELTIEAKHYVYYKLIELLSSIGKFQEAKEMCEIAEKNIEKISQVDNYYTSDILVLKSNISSNSGNFKESQRLLEKAQNICYNILGENHTHYSSLSLKLAEHLMLNGDFKTANNLILKALEINSKKYGKHHLSTLQPRNKLITYYELTGNYNKALLELDTVKLIFQNSELSINPTFQVAINCCEARLKNYNEPGNSLKHWLKAEETTNKIYSQNSLQLCAIYDGIINLYMAQRDLKNAYNYINKKIDLTNFIYGENSLHANLAKLHLIDYYIAVGDFQKSYEILSLLESISIETYGENNYNICGILNRLGSYYLGQSNYKKSKEYFERSYNIQCEVYGKNHFFVVDEINSLSNYYYRTGDSYKALELDKEAISILEYNQVPDDSYIYINSELNLCQHYIALEDISSAEKILTEKKYLLSNNELFYALIARVQAYRGKYYDAIKSVEKAIQIAETRYGKDKALISGYYQQLSEIYSNIPNYEKSLEYIDLAIDNNIKFFGENSYTKNELLLGKAYIYFNYSKLKDARILLDIIKNSLIQQYGDSPQMLIPAQMLEAKILLAEGKVIIGLEQMKGLEEIHKSIYEDGDTGMNTYYLSLADAYTQNGKIDIAINLLENIVNLITEKEGQESISVLNPLTILANCYKYIGNANKSTEYYEKAKEISTLYYGANDIRTAFIDSNIAEIELNNFNLTEAYKKLKRYYDIVIKTFGESPTNQLANVNRNFGQYYSILSLKNVEEGNKTDFSKNTILSINHYKKAVEITEQVYGESHPNILKDLFSLADTYFMLNEPDSALKQIKKAETITINWFGEKSIHSANVKARMGNILYAQSDNGRNPSKINDAKYYFEDAIEIANSVYNDYPSFAFKQTYNWKSMLLNMYGFLKNEDKIYELLEDNLLFLENLPEEEKPNFYFEAFDTCWHIAFFYEEIEAIKQAEELITLIPQLPLPYKFSTKYVYAIICDESKDYDTALIKYKECSKLGNQLPDEMKNRDIINKLDYVNERIKELEKQVN